MDNTYLLPLSYNCIEILTSYALCYPGPAMIILRHSIIYEDPEEENDAKLRNWRSQVHYNRALHSCFCRLISIYLYWSTQHYMCLYTAKWFTDLVEYIFTMPDVQVFLSQWICQDPLENFFGCQWQCGGTHDNPSVQEFQKNMQALRVINSFARGPAKGNCMQRLWWWLWRHQHACRKRTNL